jgi:hypothetical protein
LQCHLCGCRNWMKTLQPSPAWQRQVSSRQQLQQPPQGTTACAIIATTCHAACMSPESGCKCLETLYRCIWV